MIGSYIVIIGNPVDGLSFYGPYDNRDDAINAGDNSPFIDGDWWVAKLNKIMSSESEAG